MKLPIASVFLCLGFFAANSLWASRASAQTSHIVGHALANFEGPAWATVSDSGNGYVIRLLTKEEKLLAEKTIANYDAIRRAIRSDNQPKERINVNRVGEEYAALSSDVRSGTIFSIERAIGSGLVLEREGFKALIPYSSVQAVIFGPNGSLTGSARALPPFAQRFSDAIRGRSSPLETRGGLGTGSAGPSRSTTARSNIDSARTGVVPPSTAANTRSQVVAAGGLLGTVTTAGADEPEERNVAAAQPPKPSRTARPGQPKLVRPEGTPPKRIRSAPTPAQPRFEAIRRQLSVAEEPAAKNTLRIKVFALKHARVREVQNVVEDLYDRNDPRIAVQESTNVMVVRGRMEVLEEIEALLLRLDQPVAEEPEQEKETASLKCYHVDDIDVKTLFDVLQTLLAGAETARLTVDAKTGNIIALGTQEVHQVIQSTIEQLQKD